MATVNSRETVDLIIANNGIYPGDENMPVVKIVEYQNIFDGGTAYGLIYEGEALDRYENYAAATVNPRTIFERKA